MKILTPLLSSLALCVLHAHCSIIPPMKPGGQAIRARQSFEVSNAVMQAQNYLDTFLSRATPAEKDAFGDYLKTYRSWYQAVTPASTAVINAYNRLRPEAHEALGAIKAIADQFVSGASGVPGSSTLSNDGNEYYQTLLAQFNTPRSKPRPEKVY